MGPLAELPTRLSFANEQHIARSASEYITTHLSTSRQAFRGDIPKVAGTEARRHPDRPSPPTQERHVARTDARSSAIMAAGTLVSRILGFVKTILLTVAIGSLSTVGDVFETANTLPNLIYVLVAGGVFNAVLVPQIIRPPRPRTAARATSQARHAHRHRHRPGHAHHRRLRLAHHQRHGLGMDPEQRQLGFIFSLWCLPQIFFYGLYTVIGQVLNAKDAFGAYMWSPVLEQRHHHPVAVPLHLPLRSADPNPNPIHTVDNWTNAQTPRARRFLDPRRGYAGARTLHPLRRLGLRLKPDFAWRGIGLRAASKLAAWTLASGIISNLAFLYMTRVAAGIVGQREHYAAMGIQIPGLQALNYASMLYMLPHGVIGISIATVLFNRMSASAIADDNDSVIYALSHGLRNAAVATVFCMVGLIVLAGPIAVLFSGGDPIAATIIARLIVITALGTPRSPSTTSTAACSTLAKTRARPSVSRCTPPSSWSS